MLLLRDNPMFRDFDALVDSLWGSSPFDGAHGMRWVSDRQVPEPTWSEHEDRLALSLPVPGLTADDLVVEVHGRRLTLRAQRRVQAPEGYRQMLRERAGWTFSRAWDLPDLVDTESLTARLDHGVLTVELQRRPEATPRRITVEHTTLIEDKEA